MPPKTSRRSKGAAARKPRTTRRRRPKPRTTASSAVDTDAVDADTSVYTTTTTSKDVNPGEEETAGPDLAAALAPLLASTAASLAAEEAADEQLNIASLAQLEAAKEPTYVFITQDAAPATTATASSGTALMNTPATAATADAADAAATAAAASGPAVPPTPALAPKTTEIIQVDPRGADDTATPPGFRLFFKAADSTYVAELKRAPYRNCVKGAQALALTFAGTSSATARLRVVMATRVEKVMSGTVPLHQTTVQELVHTQTIASAFVPHQEIALDGAVLNAIENSFDGRDVSLTLSWLSDDGEESELRDDDNDESSQATFTLAWASVYDAISGRVELGRATPNGKLPRKRSSDNTALVLRRCDVLFVCMPPVAPVPQVKLTNDAVQWVLHPQLSANNQRLQYLFPPDFYLSPGAEETQTTYNFDISITCAPSSASAKANAASPEKKPEDAMPADTFYKTFEATFNRSSDVELSGTRLTDHPFSALVPEPCLATPGDAAPTREVLVVLDREAVIKFAQFPRLHWTSTVGATRNKPRVVAAADHDGVFTVRGLQPNHTYEMWYFYPNQNAESAKVVVSVPP